tara:strand:- start:1905 stop:2021 length:117 start_codon:yes stop_codon:yes gene_type:complete
MEYIINGFCLGIGFIAGMYITTQISIWIGKNINKNGKS